MNHTYVFCFWGTLLFISGIITYIEVRNYYREEREMQRTNDMNIFHISILSLTGTIAIASAAVSIIALILEYLVYIKVLFKH